MKWLVRILLGAVGLVVLAVLGLWLAGFRSGAGKNSSTVEIDRPAAQVWRYLDDDELVKKWVSGLSEIRHLNPETRGVGARFIIAEAMGNERTEMEMEVTAFEPHRRIAFRVNSLPGASPGFTETAEYLLEEHSGRTRLTLSGESKYFPFWIQLMEPIITPAAQKKLDGDLARMKAMLEAEPRTN